MDTVSGPVTPGPGGRAGDSAPPSRRRRARRAELGVLPNGGGTDEQYRDRRVGSPWVRVSSVGAAQARESRFRRFGSAWAIRVAGGQPERAKQTPAGRTALVTARRADRRARRWRLRAAHRRGSRSAAMTIARDAAGAPRSIGIHPSRGVPITIPRCGPIDYNAPPEPSGRAPPGGGEGGAA